MNTEHGIKHGLIMEGGAMRGLYTCGVIDVFLEKGITFDGAIGVSAGAAFGCNFKSRQIGRARRYITKFTDDSRFGHLGSLLKYGDIFEPDFCYREIPLTLDPFDSKTFSENPMKFYVTCTDVKTGKAVYHLCEKGDVKDIEWMRASASMPLVSQLIEIDGQLLSDGGTADSVPLFHMENLGYSKNVVILTQPDDYRKKANALMPLIRAKYGRKYPEFVDALSKRHIRYNQTVEYVRMREKEGAIFVIRPSEKLPVSRMEHDKKLLDDTYMAGYLDGQAVVKQVRAFLEQ